MYIQTYICIYIRTFNVVTHTYETRKGTNVIHTVRPAERATKMAMAHKHGRPDWRVRSSSSESSESEPDDESAFGRRIECSTRTRRREGTGTKRQPSNLLLRFTARGRIFTGIFREVDNKTDVVSVTWGLFPGSLAPRRFPGARFLRASLSASHHHASHETPTHFCRHTTDCCMALASESARLGAALGSLWLESRNEAIGRSARASSFRIAAATLLAMMAWPNALGCTPSPKSAGPRL